MIQKISFGGYTNTTPFKLIYLCDEYGLSSLAECYSLLITSPLYGYNEDNNGGLQKSLVENWIIDDLTSELTKQESSTLSRYNFRIPGTYDIDQPAWEKAKEKNKEEIEALRVSLEKIREQIPTILSSSEYLAVPISIGNKPKENIKGLKNVFNHKYKDFKYIRDQERDLANSSSQYSYGSWVRDYVEGIKRNILNRSSWASPLKLVINGNLTDHPCVLCPRVYSSLQGECGLGGSMCANNLNESLIRKLESDD